MASPSKLAHVVLFTPQVAVMRDWYVTVLEGRVVFENQHAAFITYDDEHHRIAVADPGGAARMVEEKAGTAEGMLRPSAVAAYDPETAPKVNESPYGLSHIAFTYSSLSDLLGTYDRLRAQSIEPGSTVNHGPTSSFYYADPDGNQIELQVDNFADVNDATTFMESQSFANNPVGVMFDPDEWLRRLREGESELSITAPTW
jgi:catechol-2,3-dioxygenase